MVPAQYQALIDQAAAQYGVPPDLLGRLLYQESRFRPDVISGQTVSKAGAQGIAQFMPETAAELGVNPLDPESAIPGAARYLAQLQKQFGGDMRAAVAAYNAGPGRVRGVGGDFSRLPAETRAYLAAVLRGGGAPAAQASPMQAFPWSPSQAATPAAQVTAAPNAASSGLLGALPAAGDLSGVLGLMGGQAPPAPSPITPQPYRPRITFKPIERRYS